jgi:hypothetical protein
MLLCYFTSLTKIETGKISENAINVSEPLGLSLEVNDGQKNIIKKFIKEQIIQFIEGERGCLFLDNPFLISVSTNIYFKKKISYTLSIILIRTNHL